MKKLTILLILFISLIFVIPIQVPAAWLNSVLRFSKNQLVKEQAQFPSEDSNNMVSESQRISQNIDTMEKTNAVVPVVNFQLSDIKTINDLKTEIVMLKTNLDNLYKAHNGLVNGHNTLLKSTTGLKKRSAILQNQSTTSSVTNTTSDILYRISELERK